MRILSLAFLYIAVTSVHGYGAAWLDLSPPHEPSFQRPVDVVTDVINELGVRILQEYGGTEQGGNVAFSPTGIGFVMAALYEGSAGVGNEQIAHVLGLPGDKDVTRIGLRDIHRRLRSYLSPDGFLGGLTLNRENTKLRPEYEEVLKFLGFDLPSGDDGTNATDSSTSLPESTTGGTTAPSETTSDPPTTAAEILTTTQEATSTVVTLTSRITEQVTTVKMDPEDVAEASTTPNVVKDTTAVATSTEDVPDPPTTKVAEEVSSTTEISTSQPTTAVVTTTESPTTVLEVSSRLTESSTAKPPTEESTEPISSTQPTTVGTVTDAPTTVTDNPEAETLASVAEVTETMKLDTTTLQSEETTTSMVVEITKESIAEAMDKSGSESEVEMSTLNPEEGLDETTTTTTEESSTLEREETASNEIVSESTTIRIDTTTVANVENLLSMENEKVNTEMTNTSSPPDIKAPERRTVRRTGIRDPVVRTLLNARSAEATTNENEDSLKSKEETEKRERRNSRSYFSNFPEFPSFPIYPDFPGLPEETSWTRNVGGWRVHSPKVKDSSRDSTELSFLVNGESATSVPAATYTVVLPFAFLPTLQALALEFPLDDPRYNILLLLPTDRDGTRRLARDLGNVGLRELRKELQPAWVRAMIPSFMLKGFVTLTPFLQRLGIRDVFEPRDADLSPMTDEEGVYARDVQQSIGVNIRNYMKPDRTHSRNGLFERAGPVSFVAEHPFLFFIVDAETGVSLIAGRIEDPLNSRIL